MADTGWHGQTSCRQPCRHPGVPRGEVEQRGWRWASRAERCSYVQNEVSCDSPACLRPEIRAFEHGCMVQLLASGRVTCHASTIFMKPDFKIGRGRDDRRTLRERPYVRGAEFRGCGRRKFHTRFQLEMLKFFKVDQNRTKIEPKLRQTSRLRLCWLSSQP